MSRLVVNLVTGTRTVHLVQLESSPAQRTQYLAQFVLSESISPVLDRLPVHPALRVRTTTTRGRHLSRLVLLALRVNTRMRSRLEVSMTVVLARLVRLRLRLDRQRVKVAVQVLTPAAPASLFAPLVLQGNESIIREELLVVIVSLGNMLTKRDNNRALLALQEGIQSPLDKPPATFVRRGRYHLQEHLLVQIAEWESIVCRGHQCVHRVLRLTVTHRRLLNSPLVIIAARASMPLARPGVVVPAPSTLFRWVGPIAAILVLAIATRPVVRRHATAVDLVSATTLRLVPTISASTAQQESTTSMVMEYLVTVAKVGSSLHLLGPPFARPRQPENTLTVPTPMKSRALLTLTALEELIAPAVIVLAIATRPVVRRHATAVDQVSATTLRLVPTISALTAQQESTTSMVMERPAPPARPTPTVTVEQAPAIAVLLVSTTADHLVQLVLPTPSTQMETGHPVVIVPPTVTVMRVHPIATVAFRVSPTTGTLQLLTSVKTVMQDIFLMEELVRRVMARVNFLLPPERVTATLLPRASTQTLATRPKSIALLTTTAREL